MTTIQKDDPAAAVLDNYRRWKGEPSYIHRTTDVDENLWHQFAILQYAKTNSYSVFCTVGGSYQLIPHSQQRFNNPRGVRYEYLMHAPAEMASTVCDLLHMIAAYPFRQQIFYYAGFVLPMGVGKTVIENSSMEYVYFTYPYKDDPRIYDPPSWGEIKIPSMLIQTLWVFPIHRVEAEMLRKQGPDAFDELCSSKKLNAEDFQRAPML